MTNRFELGLHLDAGGTDIPTLAQCLDRMEQGEIIASKHLDDTTLFLETDGRDWMPVKWVLGDLGRLAAQLQAALPRLEQGEPAIVRSAVDDRDPVTYLLFEVAYDKEDEGSTYGNRTVYISNFFLLDGFGFSYPIGDATRVAALYAHVAEQREQLLVRPPHLPVANDIKRAPFPLDQLLKAISVQVELASRLYQALGVRIE